MSDNSQLELIREAANRPPYKQMVYVNAGQLLAEIECEYVPQPRFSNGEHVHFGDWFTAKKYGIDEPEQLKRLCIYSPELLREWGQDDGDKFAFELNYTRPADIDYRFDKWEKPVPEVLDADGVPIHKGEVLYSVSLGSEKPRVASVSPFGGGHRKANGEPTVDYENGLWDLAADLTHKQPDSLERIEEDAKLDVCVYFGHDQQSCEGCPVRRNPDECEAQKALDLLSRQREVLERGR